MLTTTTMMITAIVDFANFSRRTDVVCSVGGCSSQCKRGSEPSVVSGQHVQWYLSCLLRQRRQPRHEHSPRVMYAYQQTDKPVVGGRLGSGTACVRRQIHQQRLILWCVSSVYSRTPSSRKNIKSERNPFRFYPHLLPSCPFFILFPPFYLAFLTLPFISFPSSSLHFFSSGHKEAPQIQLEDLAERCELPQQSPGQSPCRSGISVTF